MRTPYKHLTLILPFVLFSLILTGQEVKTNAKGEKIIVYPDGTWKYFHKKAEADPFASTTLANAEKSNSGKEKNTSDQREKEVKLYIMSLAEEALVIRRGIMDEIQVESEKVASLRQRQSEFAEGLITMTNRELNDLNRSLYISDLRESLNLSRLEKANQVISITNAMMEADRKERDKMFSEYEVMKEQLFVLMEQQLNIKETAFIGSETVDKSQTSVNIQDKKDGSCQFAFDGMDEIKGKVRRTLQPVFLLSYTRDDLRDYFPDEDMIIVNASITELGGGKTFLLLEFYVKSPNAKNAYGGIARNAILTIRTFDEEQVRLVCSLGDEGHYNELNNVFTFRAQYPISKGEAKVLKRSEVDQMRVVWKTGYEDYGIHNVDFFVDQFDCLK